MMVLDAAKEMVGNKAMDALPMPSMERARLREIVVMAIPVSWLNCMNCADHMLTEDLLQLVKPDYRAEIENPRLGFDE